MILFLHLDLSLAAHRNAYRISRSSNRKKKESYDYNFDYDTGSQAGHDIVSHEDTYGTEHISVGKSGYSEGSGELNELKNLYSYNFYYLFLYLLYSLHYFNNEFQ